MDQEERKEDLHTGEEAEYSPAADFVLSLLFLSLSIFLLVEGLKMPIRRTLIVSPGFVPTICGIVLVVLNLALLISTTKAGGPSRISEWLKGSMADSNFHRWLTISFLTGVYIYCVGRFPFILLTFGYLCLTFCYLRIGTLKSILLVAVLATIFTAYLLPLAFNLPLP